MAAVDDKEIDSIPAESWKALEQISCEAPFHVTTVTVSEQNVVEDKDSKQLCWQIYFIWFAFRMKS